MADLMQAIAGLLLAALAVMGSPGPSTISLTAVAASHGARAALGYGAGLVAGTVAVLLLVAAGLSTLLLAWPQAVLPVQIAALAYCLFLAWRIATAPPLQTDDASAAAPGFVSGLFLGLANPKAYLAIAAVYSSARLLPMPLGDAAPKLALLSIMIVLIHAAWLLFGAGLAQALRKPGLSRGLNILLAVALVLSLALTF